MPVFKKPAASSHVSPPQPNLIPPSQNVREPQPKPPVSITSGTIDRLNSTYRTIITELNSEIEELKRDSESLDKAYLDMNSNLAQLSQDLLSTQKGVSLSGETQKITDWISESANLNTDNWSPEDYIEFKDALSRQYLESKSQELSYADLIEKLIQAFNHGVIESKDMVKYIKDLASKQFLAARLREKISKIGKFN